MKLGIKRRDAEDAKKRRGKQSFFLRDSPRSLRLCVERKFL